MQHDSMNGTPGSDPGGLDFLDFPSSPGSQPRCVGGFPFRRRGNVTGFTDLLSW